MKLPAVANASAWQWWPAVTHKKYKDGQIYVKPSETGNDGIYSDSKLMWTLGNFSRFIRPDAVRPIPEAGFDEPQGVMATAYLE